MPLDTEVGLDSGNVLDGYQAPPPQKGGTQQPQLNFSACIVACRAARVSDLRND